MKDKSINLILFILTLIATAGIIIGVDTDIDENSIYSLKHINSYEQNINDLRLLVDNLEGDLIVQKESLSYYNNPNYIDDINNMNSFLEELRLYNGFTDVRGPGIYLRVSDSTSDDVDMDIMDKIVHDVDITVLLNDLKSAGVEAIEVNGKRIINKSEVVCAGPLLKINGDGVPAPFIIRAIGDMDELYKAVTEKGTYAYDLKNKYGMEVAVMKSYNVSIPKFYENNYNVEYAQIVER
ncbi:DUF881 domain-containing protein [Sedimentibacter sp. MB31-C6]|uniref:DUF881 domain-containing protein n=1 Tax=Sedimentibacter sp. MB31-C6 TaxID=3109366 RepID=UPI002DDD57F4|nr:DUF881 domain-containing protein [Sedimentibacter sp. MB36-C1]WSI03768.1 DUF881 domain-containing protein [Sedimentibacter sp. MB36-C1]